MTSPESTDAPRCPVGTKVFLGGPFEALLPAGGGPITADHRQRYQDLIAAFESAGCTVFSAHRNEGWGQDLLSPEECTPVDFEAVAGCDLFVAIPGDPASLGTHVEIGWASALGKPLVLLTAAGRARCALVRGIASVTEVEWVEGPSGEPEVESVLAAAGRCLARWSQTRADGTGDRGCAG